MFLHDVVVFFLNNGLGLKNVNATSEMFSTTDLRDKFSC
jgi:hypothetical protein